MENYPPSQHICQNGEPLLKLQEGGKAPILNYSLQQDTSFTAYSGVSMNLPADYFTQLAKQIPATQGQTLPASYTASAFAITYEDGVVNPPAWGNIEVLSNTEISTLRIQANDLVTQANRLGGYKVTLEEQPIGTLSTENAWKQALANYLENYNPIVIAEQRTLGSSIIIDNRNGGGKRITFGTRPTTGGATPTIISNPQFYFIEEYQTISFARDYGAGKTLQIHSLFPGEKTTVTIKTFKELKTVKSDAENIIDSFSQESAREFESTLERETSKNTTKTRGGGANANVSLSPPKGGSVSGGANYSASNTRTSNTRNLSKAVSKSVDKSNSSRQININTSTQETQTESEEVATVRQFENINKSRVLNLAFRELLQQYITVVYLRDVKILFTNGHTEYDLIYSIEDLNELLATHIADNAKREEVKDRILFEYGKLVKETNNTKVTVEGVDVTQPNYFGLIEAFSQTNFLGESIRYLRKNANLQNIYRHTSDDIKGYAVDGVILDVQQYTLRTPAVVVDAFLGQGEALDCYSVAMQQEAVKKVQMENEKVRLENERIEKENDKIALDNTLRREREELERQKIESEARRLEQETRAIDALVQAFSNGQVTPSQFADAIGNIFHPNPPKARWSYNSQNG